jgi:AcrR family transcriptional regulator
MVYSKSMASSPKSGQRRGRPARYTKEQVVRLALTVLEQDPSKPLTLRRVSDELGVSPMAIYGYVEGLDDLLQEAAVLALEETRVPIDPDAPWDAQIRAALLDVYHIGRQYPNLVNTAFGRSSLKTPNIFRIREQILEQLQRGGFDDTTSLHALGLLLAYSLGFATVGARYEPLPLLPSDTFPTLVRLRNRYEEHVSETSFEVGLDRLLDSLKREADR